MTATDTTPTRAELVAQRDQLIAEADAILDRSTDGLTGADREQFETLEQRMRMLTSRIDIADRSAVMAAHPLAPFLGGDPGPQPHQLPPLSFSEDELRSAFDEVRSGRPATAVGELETRASVSLPVAVSNVPTYDMNVVTKRIEPTRIAELLTQRPVGGPSVIFYQETTGSTSAATVLEGATKPESAPNWTAVTSNVRKIAHFTNVSKESLDDFDGFSQLIQGSMLRGLVSAENLQVLSGDGVAPNLKGFLNTSGILTYAPGSAEARFLSILHAQQLLRSGSAFAIPDVVVLNPADYEILAKTNSSSAGIHLADTMVGSPAASVWGMRIVQTSQISSGTALVLDSTAAVIFSREPVTAFLDPYSGSTANLVKIIMEERIGLGVLQPAAMCAVTFNGAA